MLLAHRIELQPNNEQTTYFLKASGVARKAYNWALEEWGRQYRDGNDPNEAALRKKLNSIKRDEFPYMLEVTKAAPQEAIKDLGQAFQHFFRRVKNGEKPGYPRFKRRGVHDSFVATNGPSAKGLDAASIDGRKIKLPIVGWIRTRERVRFSGQIKQVTVSRTANKWYASILIDTDVLPHERKNHGPVGVDLGINKLAVLSDGTKIEGPKAHKNLLRKLRKLNKALARSKRFRNDEGYLEDSSNRKKGKAKLAKLHKRIADIRRDSLHKATTYIVLNYDVIGIEDLNVQGMIKNRRLSRSIMDQGFGEFRELLAYKAKWYDSQLFVAGRWFPSSKMCSSCGVVKPTLSLAERTYRCNCGNEIDRDLNAAINLKTFAASSAEKQNACGEISAGAISVA